MIMGDLEQPQPPGHQPMESLLTCPICLDTFTKPVVILPCQHCLCRGCAEDCFDKRGTRFGISGGRFKCPTCRYEVILDRHGVYGLQRNLLIENILDNLEQNKNVEIRKEAQKEAEEEEKRLAKEAELKESTCVEHKEKLNVYQKYLKCCHFHLKVIKKIFSRTYCLTCQALKCATCKVFGSCQNCSVIHIDQAKQQHLIELHEAISLTTSSTDRVQAAIKHCEELLSRCNDIEFQARNNVNWKFD